MRAWARAVGHGLCCAAMVALAAGCSPPRGGGNDSDFLARGWQSALVEADEADAGGDLGSGCADDGDCKKKMMCTSGGLCACRPGLVACGKRCVDLVNDPHYCGTCGNKCSSGLGCVAGVCGGPKLKDPLPFPIDGADAPHTCTASNEAYPEASLNAPPAEGARFFVQFQHKLGSGGSTNWAATPTLWSSYYYDTPHLPGTPAGDSWATSSSYTGLEYVSDIFHVGVSNHCVGIAATDALTMSYGGPPWPYPMGCATPQTSYLQDGPSIHYDEAGTTLWVVSTDQPGASAQPVLRIFPNCGQGAPGGAQCALGTTVTVDNNLMGHATATVNPCTHHAIVAYRTTVPNVRFGTRIRLKFYDSSGLAIGSPYDVEVGSSFGTATGCTGAVSGVPACGVGEECKIPDAGGGPAPDCARVASKVHVATKLSGGQCYAYIAYDSNFLGVFDGKTHMRANFAIVNITSETSPVLAVPIMRHPSDTGAQYNSYGSICTASAYTNSVGWFYYSDSDVFGYSNPCSTSYEGKTNTNLGISGSWTDQTLDSGFPALKLNGADYVGIIKRGLPGGSLFPSWHRAITTEGVGYGCTSCQGLTYTLTTYATEVVP
jgi:hypothetical protein